MEKLKILCGFENEDFEAELVKQLKRAGVNPEVHVRYSKESIVDFLEKNTDCSTVVLPEKIDNEKYTAEEYAQLTDKRDINIVAILGPRLQGTEYMRTLYTANITGAIFQFKKKGIEPRDVVEQILSRRSRKEARVYYGIEGQRLDMSTLDDDTFVEYYRRLKSSEFVLKGFVELCAKMTPRQIADFTKKLPKETVNDLIKYEEFHQIVDLLRKFGIDLKIRRPKKLMLGFKEKPMLGMSEGGLIFETSREVVKEEHVQEEQEEVQSVSEEVSGISVDVSSGTADTVDDIFAMLDGGEMAGGHTQGGHAESAVARTDVVETAVVEETEETVSAEVSERAESERILEEKLKEKERLLEEKERMLAEERERASEGVKKLHKQYEEELISRDKEHESELSKVRKENAALNKQHEKEIKKLQKKQADLEKETSRRYMYEEDDEDEEDVYLSISGPQFSVGFVIVVVLAVAAVLALVFLKPMFSNIGM